MLRAIRRARIYKVCGGAQQPILNKLSIQCQGVGQRDRFVLLRRTIFETNKWYVAECGSVVSGIDCKIIQK